MAVLFRRHSEVSVTELDDNEQEFFIVGLLVKYGGGCWLPPFFKKKTIIMYDFNNISSALMMIYDELKNDKASKKLVSKIDRAESDEQIKAGLREGVKRLRELDKNALADDIEKKTKGFAF